MTQKEKENRIHSFALEFLERQQIVPNLYADQIIKGYKEGYLQAEQDFEAKEVNLEKEFDNYAKDILACDVQFQPFTHLYNCAKYFYELGLKAQSKDMIEALRTEYEKGRADVIADTLSWLENCWPKYCSYHTIIEGFKEAIKY